MEPDEEVRGQHVDHKVSAWERRGTVGLGGCWCSLTCPSAPPPLPFSPWPQLLDVGLRELEEETGLHLEVGTFSWKMLGLWEVTSCSAGGGWPQHHQPPLWS